MSDKYDERTEQIAWCKGFVIGVLVGIGAISVFIFFVARQVP